MIYSVHNSAEICAHFLLYPFASQHWLCALTNSCGFVPALVICHSIFFSHTVYVRQFGKTMRLEVPGLFVKENAKSHSVGAKFPVEKKILRM